MQEMQVDIEQPRSVLRKGVEPRLLGPPVKAGLPVLNQLPQVFEIGSIRPSRPRRLVGEPRARQPLPQVGERRRGDVERYCRDLSGHFAVPEKMPPPALATDRAAGGSRLS